MKITIYNPDATVFKEVILLDGSMMTNGIRENHDVTLCFSSEEELSIPEGAYVVFEGETFIAKSKSKIEMSHTRSYTYTVKMNGAPTALSSVRLRNPADGKLSFPYTASAHDHLALIVSNMNRYGGGGWSIGDCIDGGEKFLQYNYISCRDALDSLADTYGTEWEIVGKTISLHKVEYNLDSPLELSYGKGSGLRPGIIRDNVQTPMTRLYTQGGSKNIDASEYGSTILLLPKSVTFKYDGNKFEDEQGFDETKARIYSTDSEGTYIKSHKNEDKDVNEGVIDCTDIYPNKLHTVLEVESGDNPRDIVLDIDEDLDYSQYQIAGEIPTITFQSGELMGKTFEIRRDQGGIIMVSKKYSAQGSFVGWKLTLSGTFESGRWLPDSQSGLVPAVGDTCRIFGVRMPSQYICDNNTKSGASWDMLRRGIMYLFECEDYIYSLKMPVDPIWARANWGSVGSKFVAGGYVRYSNSGWAQGGVIMRIKTIRQDISHPYSIEVSLSNGIVGGGVLKGLSDSISNQAGSISEQQDTQKKLEYNVSSLSGNYVTIDTEQTITAPKTFAEDATFGAAREDGSYSRLLIPSSSGPGIYDLYVSTDPVDGEVPSASGGIDEDELWTILGGSSTNKVIDPSHIPVIPVEKVSGLGTALSSYATKEWVESKGYLTSVSLSTISDLHASWDSLLQSAPDFYSKGSVYSKSEADGRFVGIANEQTVTGRKTFDKLLTASAGLSGTNADLSGYISATKLYLPYSGGNKVYDILVSTEPIDGEAPSEGGGINEDELWTILGGSGTQKIGASHIPTLSELSGNLDSSRITGLDSALTGYVKKAGDTMTGPLTITTSSDDILIFNDTEGEKYFRIKAKANGTDWGGLVLDGRSSVQNLYLGTTSSGYKVWHSGNDGSGSGLDADLLDGHEGSWYRNNALGFTRVKTPTSSDHIDLNTDLNSGGMVSNYTSNNYWDNAPAGLSYGSALGLLNNSTISLGAQFIWDVNHNVANATRSLWFRAANNLGWDEAWHQIAFTESNVASATKLANSRTLWGRPFDGTGNVSGAISSTGNITPSAAGSYNIGTASLWYERIYGRYIDTASGYNLRLCTGGVEHLSIQASSGNVGIGTIAPAHKLDVIGDIRTSGYLRSTRSGVTSYIGSENSSWLHFYTNASTGFYFDKLVSVRGGLYMYDSSSRLYIPSSSGNQVFDAYIA